MRDVPTCAPIVFCAACPPCPAQAGGPVKVAAHLAFGLLVIAAEQMLRMLG